MASNDSPAAPGSKRILGFPLEGFGCLTSLLLTLASAFFTFFAVTTVAIFALLGWNELGGHTVNYAYSYLYAGLPAGLLVLAVAAPLFALLWIRARRRR
jgi:hypothetical protein